MRLRIAEWGRARIAPVLALASLLVFVTGCGGGGGPSPTGGTTVTGKILSGESGAVLTSRPTINIGGNTATADTTGAFSVSGVGTGSQTATVSATGAQPRTLALTVPTNTNPFDVGTIYLSNTGYNATVTGRIVALSSSGTGGVVPVGGATVTLAGATTTTAANGTYTLNNLPVGLGQDAGGNTVLGQVTATGFDVKPITVDLIQFVLRAGSNPLNDIQLAGGVSGTTPLPPYTVQVTVTGTGASAATVTLATTTTQLGAPISTDGAGHFFYWVVPGAYTATATVGGVAKTGTVTLAATNQPVNVTIAF